MASLIGWEDLCPTCDEVVLIVDDHLETAGYEEAAHDYRVLDFECGHSIEVQARGRLRPCP